MPSTHAVCLALVLGAALTGARQARAADSPDELNLLSWGEGARVVPPTPQQSAAGQWSANELLDEVLDTGWANPRGDLTPKALVFELDAKGRITHFVFDTAQVYSKERAAKDVKIEISDSATGGFVEIAHATLAPMKDGQTVALATPALGRCVRLTVPNGYGDTLYMEIMNFKALGTFVVPPAAHDCTGTYDSGYGKLHLQQTGNSVVGCYEHLNGLVETGVAEGACCASAGAATRPPTSAGAARR